MSEPSLSWTIVWTTVVAHTHSSHRFTITTLTVYNLAMGDAGRRDGKKRGRSRGGGDGVALPRHVILVSAAAVPPLRGLDDIRSVLLCAVDPLSLFLFPFSAHSFSCLSVSACVRQSAWLAGMLRGATHRLSAQFVLTFQAETLSRSTSHGCVLPLLPNSQAGPGSSSGRTGRQSSTSILADLYLRIETKGRTCN